MQEPEKKTIVWVGALAENAEGKLLFLKRARNSSWGAGRWQLPGGKMDWGEAPIKTLKREMAEETNGCKLLKPEFLGMHVSYVKAKGTHYHVLQIIYKGKIKGNVRTGGDHDDLKWMDLEETKSERFAPSDLRNFIARWYNAK